MTIGVRYYPFRQTSKGIILSQHSLEVNMTSIGSVGGGDALAYAKAVKAVRNDAQPPEQDPSSAMAQGASGATKPNEPPPAGPKFGAGSGGGSTGNGGGRDGDGGDGAGGGSQEDKVGP